MRAFHDSLVFCVVKDLSFSGEKFTSVNKQNESNFIQERLDRYLGNLAWCSLFPRAHVSNLPFYHSDHRAIKVTLDGSSVWIRKIVSSRKSRCFHFEEIWAMDTECKDLVDPLGILLLTG